MTKRRAAPNESPMSTPISTADAIPVKAETVSDQPPTADPLRSASPSKIELEAAVTELKAALAEARQAAHAKETVLQEQIATLQSNVQEQRTLIEKLQTDLQQSQQIKAELETAKTVILKLSQLNTQLAPPAPAPTPEPAAPLAPSTRAPEPKAPPAPLVPQREQRREIQRDVGRDVRRDVRPAPPRFPVDQPQPTVEQKEGKISEMDIGWMD